jgi:hypothetical protein
VTGQPGVIALALADHLDGAASCTAACRSAWEKTQRPVKAITSAELTAARTADRRT